MWLCMCIGEDVCGRVYVCVHMLIGEDVCGVCAVRDTC